MGDPISLESAANRWEAGSAAFGESDGAPMQTEARVCRGNSFQEAAPLPPVPASESYGVCVLKAVKAPRENNVCELDYCPLPPVCPADDEAAAADAASARTGLCPSSENMVMPPGPAEWNDIIPIGWKKYEGAPSFFHCGFRGLVADCHPDRYHLQNEVFYNRTGHKVENLKTGDYLDIDYRCAGTPNADDADKNWVRHTFSTGGIFDAGWTGFVGSIVHADREEHELENEIDPPDSDAGK